MKHFGLAVAFLLSVPLTLPADARTVVTQNKPALVSTCKSSSSACVREAASKCGGQYRVIDSESHAGGLLGDAVPGPVTWYSMTYQCGRSDGSSPRFVFRGPAYNASNGNAPAGGNNASDMTDYCRGEVAGAYNTRPRNVTVSSPMRGVAGGFVVTGSVDLGANGNPPFQCLFDAYGDFQSIEWL
ncbi:hypothetical protein ABIB57_004974 [Devosia sp. UYZn731]|uniref:hypothetical protein n=1 Tax=Devosia sp. UYZn731 TaxID=3156345 RepID=UPI0033985CAD